VKKNFYLSLAILLTSFSLANASDNSKDVFLHIDSGMSFSRNLKGTYKDNMGSSPVFGLGAKYQISPKIKIGTNFEYKPSFKYSHLHPSDDGYKPLKTTQKINISSIMMNGSYDIININDRVIPYIELGAGIARVSLGEYKMETFGEENNGKVYNNLALSSGLGVSFKVNDKAYIDLSYKYKDFGKIRQASLYEEIEKGRITSNEFLVSLRFKL
jgi:opacity protein-like surface antigen